MWRTTPLIRTSCLFMTFIRSLTFLDFISIICNPINNSILSIAHEMSHSSSWKEVEDSDALETPCKCLLCLEILPSVDDMLTHCRNSHKFDLLMAKRKLELDFYGTLKLVNWIRTSVFLCALIPAIFVDLQTIILSFKFYPDPFVSYSFLEVSLLIFDS